MGEYMNTQVELHTADPAAGAALREAGFEWVDRHDDRWEANGEQNYGTASTEVEELLQTARKRGWSYFAQDDPKYDLGGTWVSWKPGDETERTGDFMGEPVISASEIRVMEAIYPDPAERWAELCRRVKP